jgi:tetratricopeptide (TPR) repeat protein
MLETGLVLRAHGYREASLNVLERAIRWLESRPKEEAETESHRLILGRTLYYSERWEESQSLFESLHQEFPDTIRHLGYLGTLAARKGEREKALNISSQLESTDWSYDWGDATFCRAKITALLRDKEQAVRLLREAHDQGVQFMHFHHVMDLEPLYDYPPFQEFMKPKG